jgi:cytochrome P450
MLYIITTPRVYFTLQAEIDLAIREGRISSPVVSDREAQQLTYLKAVIKEGLRIWPPGTGLLAKVVPPEGDTSNGLFLPGGTDIGVNTWAIMRNAEVFGGDADIFRPERWLEANPEQTAKMEKSLEWVWGYGKYVCMGKSVALIELRKVFVEVSSRRVLASRGGTAD